MTVNPNPEGPLRNIIGGFKLVIKGTSRQGEFNALHDPGDCICDPLQLDSKKTKLGKLKFKIFYIICLLIIVYKPGGIIRDNPVAEKLLMTDLAR